MRETWVIAKREFLERVRTKWFVVMTVIGPILLVGLIVIPAVLAGRGVAGAKIEIVDHDGRIGPPLQALLASPALHWQVTLAPPRTPEPALLERIKSNEINGFIEVPADVLTGGTVVYKGDNASNQAIGLVIQKLVAKVVTAVRARDAGLTEDQLVKLLADVNVETKQTNGETGGESGIGTFLLGYVIAFILYMVITLYGINVMRSVVTEKSSRVVELLVAATKPRSMMAGKIIGVGGAGLAQISIWFVLGGVALAYRESILGLIGVSAGAGSLLPALSAQQIAVIVAFFVLGYLYYSTMYAAVGATVASEQDSQQAQLPITMFLVIGMVSMTAITGDPRGTTSVVMTQVPFWSPMLMPLRYLLGGATPAEVGMSLAILVVSTYVIARVAAKIFRVGILMYGKRPSLGELIRWLRY